MRNVARRSDKDAAIALKGIRKRRSSDSRAFISLQIALRLSKRIDKLRSIRENRLDDRVREVVGTEANKFQSESASTAVLGKRFTEIWHSAPEAIVERE